MTAAMTVRHLRPTELAERWGMTEKRLADDRALGKGPAFLKVGSSVRYRLIDIEAFEAKHLVLPVD